MRKPAREMLAAAVGQPVPATDPPGDSPIGDGIVVLRRVHRYEGSIGVLAEAIQTGDGDAAIGLLAAGETDVCWIPIDLGGDRADTAESLGVLRAAAAESGQRLVEAALPVSRRGARGARRFPASCAPTAEAPRVSARG